MTPDHQSRSRSQSGYLAALCQSSPGSSLSTQSNHKWQMKCRWATLPLNWQHGVRTWAKVWPRRIIHELLITTAIIIFAAGEYSCLPLHYWCGWCREWWGGRGALTRCHLLRLPHSAIIPHTHRCHPGTRHWSCSPGTHETQCDPWWPSVVTRMALTSLWRHWTQVTRPGDVRCHKMSLRGLRSLPCLRLRL